MRRCNCTDCANTDGNKEKIADARRQVLKRNPRAFNPKFAKGSPTKETVAGAKHVKGCNCKNSKCQRNYCECFAMGVACYPKCRCENCENGKHGPQQPGEDAASDGFGDPTHRNVTGKGLVPFTESISDMPEI